MLLCVNQKTIENTKIVRCALIEEEEYKLTGSNRLFEYDSDESINTYGYGHEPFTLPPAFQPMPNFAQYNSNEFLFHSPHLNQRRHSSYSHEDILHMKYQTPPVDPRYRDSRPFIKSSSNIYDHARRDFMSRRRSSSSLQEDILRPFQQIQLNEYMRKSSPTMNRTRSNSPNASSDQSNSNLNLNNPAIFIEEYNDHQTEVKSNNSSTNLSFTNESPNQPLNEESVAGCDNIPFIDDENDQVTQPIATVAVGRRATIQSGAADVNAAAVAAAFMNKNRKTVSFDLMDSMEELNRIRRSNVILNKSSTCDHITNVKFNKCKAGCAAAVGNKAAPAATVAANEPIFKFCTLKQYPPSVAHPSDQRTESFKKHPSVDIPYNNIETSENSDFSCNNLSAYFDDGAIGNEYRSDGRIGCRPSTSIIDAKAMTLDLTDLQSDSTNSSNDHPRPIGLEAKPSKFAYIAAWKPPAFFDKMNFGHGKVRALRNYFEKMKLPADVAPISQSTPDLSSTADSSTQKLNADERRKVLEQLQEWSEFGTVEKPKRVGASVVTANPKPKPIMRSVLNLTVTTSFDERQPHTSDHNTEWSESNRCQSAPDVREHKKFPDAYIVRRQKVRTNIKSTTHDLRKSCPELVGDASPQAPKPFIISSKLKTNIYSSPCHRSSYQTLRKIKQNQKANKMAKCCRHRANGGDVSHQQQQSSAGDGDGDGTDIEPR